MVASGRCPGVGGWLCPCRLCICLYFGFSAGRVGELPEFHFLVSRRCFGASVG